MLGQLDLGHEVGDSEELQEFEEVCLFRKSLLCVGMSFESFVASLEEVFVLEAAADLKHEPGRQILHVAIVVPASQLYGLIKVGFRLSGAVWHCCILWSSSVDLVHH